MSGNTRRKNHHFIPKGFQKSFTVNEAGSQIWFAEKNATTGVFKKPVLRNIETTFRKRNLYTIHVDDKPSDILEREYYGPLDDDLGKLFPFFNEHLKSNKLPLVTADTLMKLRIIVFEMLKRTPEFGYEKNAGDVGKEVILEAFNDLSNSLSDEDKYKFNDYLNDEKFMKRVGNDVIVKAKTLPMKLVEKILKKYTIRWVEADQRHSFILSSMCCYRIGNGGSNALSNINAEIWMPISPKHCLVLVQDPHRRIPLLSIASGRKVQQVNEYAASDSNEIASHSEALLKATIKRLS
ncbi:DUF4238 domain-containing protein [Pseudochrobactrum asaccharolyticum]|uniref:DUF4238 domain-containing protein n=1 Tax=Pseudochrobactrum asaccharolyticum TaxID=354351 RepID=UPI004041FC5B